ncbi:MAG: LysM peptidoglycan-binding domain-containing protein [Simkania negevensis]|nr:LysM peptidoglycan-binding domain-containing protein [Simkania negevensis]
MKEDPARQFPIKRSRWLLHAFIVSGALNIGLLLTFIISAIQKKEESLLSYEKRIEKVSKPLSFSNQEILKKYLNFSFNELLKELTNTTLVEEGYRVCDLALACLSHVHHLDVERALSGTILEKRQYVLTSGEGKEKIFLTLFPALSLANYKTLFYFLDKEKWPFTPEGLFYLLKQNRGEADSSLLQAFFVTSQFYIIENAFKSLPLSLPRETLLSLLLDGEWKESLALYEELKKDPDRKIASVGKFLSGYLPYRSQLAAQLLLLLDKEFAYKNLSNEEMTLLLSLLEEETPELEKFLEEVKESLRPQEIRERTERKETGVKEVAVKEIPSSQKASSEKTHVVAHGDTLWKISRQYKVDVAEIKRVNQLKSDNLAPGTVLKIP